MQDNIYLNNNMKESGHKYIVYKRALQIYHGFEKGEQ